MMWHFVMFVIVHRTISWYMRHDISIFNETIYKIMYVPQGKLSVLYCIKMWWMLNTPPRSTLHSAVDLKIPDIVHWFPATPNSYSPSTALCAPHRGSEGYFCHAILFRARFSKFVLKALICLFMIASVIAYSLLISNHCFKRWHNNIFLSKSVSYIP